MWKSGQDVNDQGETVRLYQHIQYGPKPLDEPLACYIGGTINSNGSDDDDNEPPLCSSCQKPLFLLVRLATSTSSSSQSSRSVQVYACNRSACIQECFRGGGGGEGTDDSSSSPICYGGKGRVVVRSRPIRLNQMAAGCYTAAVTTTTTQSSTAAANDDEWGSSENDTADAGKDNDMDDLEQKLAALEAKKPSTTTTKPSKKDSTNNNNSTSKKRSFPCYAIHAINEPLSLPSHAAVAGGADEDEDDVGMVVSDEKVRNMLARYMAEEEDADIVSMLQANSKVMMSSSSAAGKGGGSGSGGKSREKDERLSASDRAMLTYSDRLKRNPRQVARYALNGAPLWSLPVVKENQVNDDDSKKNTPKKQKKQQNKSKSSAAAAAIVEQPIPPCPCCGAPRVFEFQLLPSLLHVLKVDEYAEEEEGNNGSTGDNNNNNKRAFWQQGGMNWGNIAVYTCSNNSSNHANGELDDGFVVVQESVDELPPLPLNMNNNNKDATTTMMIAKEDVVIAEGTQFNDDDEDGIVEEDEDMDSEDEDEDEAC